MPLPDRCSLHPELWGSELVVAEGCMGTFEGPAEFIENDFLAILCYFAHTDQQVLNHDHEIDFLRESAALQSS